MNYTDLIQIETTQNVRLEYEVASVGDRILAWLIDTLINAGFIALVLVIYDITGVVKAAGETLTVILVLAIILPWAFYHLLCEVFMDGQSIGKRFRKIKVIRTDGTSPSFGNYLIRWFLRLLENVIFPGVSFVAVLASEKGQRLGDLAAGTAVAKVSQRTYLSDTILNFTRTDYVPGFPGVQYFTNKDIEIIKYVLKLHRETNKFLILRECAMKVRSLLGIDPQQDTTPNEILLQKVVDDYTYYKSREEA